MSSIKRSRGHAVAFSGVTDHSRETCVNVTRPTATLRLEGIEGRLVASWPYDVRWSREMAAIWRACVLAYGLWLADFELTWAADAPDAGASPTAFNAWRAMVALEEAHAPAFTAWSREHTR